MRHQGRITVWKDEKGYGFVTPGDDGDPVFLHISDFSERHKRPAIGDLVSYDIGKGDRGKMKAVAAAFVDRPSRSFHRSSRPRRHPGFAHRVATAVAICAIAYVVCSHLPGNIRDYLPPSSHATVPATLPRAGLLRGGEAFQCSGKTRCSQMTSCEEATFYLNNCPNTSMDGDNDGVPCETQWCH